VLQSHMPPQWHCPLGIQLKRQPQACGHILWPVAIQPHVFVVCHC